MTVLEAGPETTPAGRFRSLLRIYVLEAKYEFLKVLSLPAGTWLGLGAILVSGALPFCALGLASGTWCGPNSAPAVVNLVYLPMAFGSGLWMPIQILPGFLQELAPWLPPHHLAQLALKTIGGDLGRPAVGHVAALLAVTVLSPGVAWLGDRRDEGKTYG